jgi:peptidoglycan/LPS O-acetylase OafA/YrhL
MIATQHLQSLRAAQPKRPAGYNQAINGFRGICVLMVFAYHVAHSGLLPMVANEVVGGVLAFFVSSWKYGVELFFMISGWVIVASLRRHGNVGAFLRDRCIRIFPVWIPVHLCVFAVGAMLGWKMFAGSDAWHLASMFVANLLLLPPLVPIPVLHPASWSLSYEWLFYLLAAATFAIHGSSKLSAGGRVALQMMVAAVAIWLLCLLPRGLFFIPGVLLALNVLPLQRYRAWLRWPALSLLVFLFAWCAVDLDQAHPGAYSVLTIVTSYKLGFAALAFVAGLHLFACISTDNGNIRWLHSSGMQLLGTVSYSFYLWHPVVMFAVKRPIVRWLTPVIGDLGSAALFASVSFGMSLLIAWLSYRMFEQGAAKFFRNRVASQPQGSRIKGALDASAPITINLKGG